jgi:hypothetical protein
VDGFNLREPFLTAREAVVLAGPLGSTLARFFATDKSTLMFSLSDPSISALFIVRLYYNKSELVPYLERFTPLSRAGYDDARRTSSLDTCCVVE